MKSAAPTTYLCNGVEGEPGAQGEPWTAGGTLPPGATETGAWAEKITEIEGETFGYAPLSFQIPLAATLDSAHVISVTGAVAPPECENPDSSGLAGAENPEADPGYLCVYSQGSFPNGNGEITGIYKPGPCCIGNGAGKSGATLYLESTEEFDFASGTFAVTGA